MKTELSKEELKQYSRHLLLDKVGDEGQMRLKNAKVLVIGAGGLGCPILQYLTAAGIGNIGIIDLDVVDQSNLQRQVLYDHSDIGKNKAKTAAIKLAKLNPYIKIEAYDYALSKKNALDLFTGYDIIVDGSDNFPTRYLVNDACILTDKPLVFGSIFKFEGQVSVFNYKGGPTYRCLFPTPPKEGEVPNCSEIGVLGVLPGIIGTFQANEVIKLVCGIGEPLSGKLLTLDALSLQQHVFNVSRNPDINIDKLLDDYEFFCGIDSSIKEMDYSEYLTKSDNLQLVDVRSYSEREEQNIGGIHIPLDELENRFEELRGIEKPLLVYCKSGQRSKKAIGSLKNFFTEKNFYNLKGGLTAAMA